MVGAASALRIKEAPNNPVTRVVELLKNMNTAADKEAIEDETVNNKWACHCDKEHASAVTAIEEANAALNSFDSKITEAAAAKERLTVEIKEADEKIAQMNQDKEDANIVRDNDRKKFHEDHQEIQDNIKALEGAVAVLGKKFSPNAINQRSTDAVMSGNEAAAVGSFLASAKGSQFGQLKSMVQTGSAGDQIFGMLSQMLKTFNEQFADDKAAEDEAQNAHENYISGVTSQVNNLNQSRLIAVEKFEEASQLLNGSEVALAEANDKLETNTQRKQQLEVDCQRVAEEYAVRSKTRGDEKVAIAQAVSVLTSDEATATFQGGFNQPSMFLQMSSGEAKRRSFAARRILNKVHSRRAAHVVAEIQQGDKDYFKVARETLSGLVEEIKQELKDDISARDSCVSQSNDAEEQNMLAGKEVSKVTNELAQTNSKLTVVSKQLEEEKKAIAEAKEGMGDATLLRMEQGDAFKDGVQDLVDGDKLMKSAVKTLEEFYKAKGSGAPQAFVQTKQEPAAAPEGFKEGVKQEGGATSVIDLMKRIMHDASEEIETYIVDYNNAESAYQDDFLSNQQNRDQAIERKNQAVEAQAQLHKDKASGESAVASSNEVLESATQALADIKEQCSFLLQYFDHRQESKQNEIDSYQDAINFLSGAQ